MRSEAARLRVKRKALRLQVVAKLGGSCVRCGFSDWRALQVDHVNGGGKGDRANAKTYERFYVIVLADKLGLYQLLCANCNWIKRYEMGEHS